MSFLSGKADTLSPSPGHRWARFARRCLPHCGAWSQATQMVSQIQTQLTMSFVREVHSHMKRTHLSQSAHPPDALQS